MTFDRAWQELWQSPPKFRLEEGALFSGESLLLGTDVNWVCESATAKYLLSAL